MGKKDKNKEKTTAQKTRKIIGIVLIVIVAYLAVGSTLPFAFDKKMSTESIEKLSETEFYGTGQGPDRALIIEQPYDAYNVRIEMIRNAEKTLDIANHLIKKSETTEAFFGEVVMAAERGVKVRILIDGETCLLDASVMKLLKELDAHPNIECQLYNPVNLLQPWYIHSLLHDKFMVADNEMLLLGGRNIDERHYITTSKNGHITNDRDVFVWQSGISTEDNESSATQLTNYMDYLWNSEYTEPIKKLSSKKNADSSYTELKNTAVKYEKENPDFYKLSIDDYFERTVETSKITLIYNPIHKLKKEPWVGWQLQSLALGAEKSVVLQTPYSTANKYILTGLEAIADNVQVEMITNSMASSPNYPAFSNYRYQRKKFIKTGINIMEYQNADSIHGKSMIIDGRISAVGSFNMDDRSMYIDTESMLVIDSPQLSAQLATAMEDISNASLQVGEENKYLPSDNVAQAKVPVYKHILMFLAFIILRLFQFLL